jgi:hypothetical protein
MALCQSIFISEEKRFATIKHTGASKPGALIKTQLTIKPAPAVNVLTN